MPERVDMTLTVTTQARLTDPEQFERIVLKANDDGAIVRLGDVARVELGARDYSFGLTRQGRPVVGAAIQLAPEANALETSALVYEKMRELEQRSVEAEKRSWRLTIGLVALAVGGGAGIAQVLRGLLG